MTLVPNDQAMGDRDSKQDALERVNRILVRRAEISAAIRERAINYRGTQRRQLLQLGDWFSRTVNASDVLARPDALALCTPLLQHRGSDVADEPMTKSGIKATVRDGCDRLRESTAMRSRFALMMVYPLLLLAMCSGLLVVFSLYLSPEFERMFREFGLQVSAGTKLVFFISAMVRRFWLVAAVIMGLAVTVCIWMTFRSTAGLGGQGRRYPSVREAWAVWAAHVAYLIEAGLTPNDAIAIAGQTTRKRQIGQFSEIWVLDRRDELRPFTSFNNHNASGISTIDYALQLTNPGDQASLLHDVAANYWDRQRSRSGWWLSWLTPLVASLVGTAVGFVILSLMGPMISLINGLT